MSAGASENQGWTLQQCEEISSIRAKIRAKAMLWASGGAAIGFVGGLSMSNVLFPQRQLGTLHVPTKAHAATESAAVHSRLLRSIGGLWTVPFVSIRGRPLRIRRHAVVTGACMLLGLGVGASAGVPKPDRQWLNAHPEPSAQQLRAAVAQAAAAREYTVIGASRASAVPPPQQDTAAAEQSDPSTRGAAAGVGEAPSAQGPHEDGGSTVAGSAEDHEEHTQQEHSAQQATPESRS